MVGSMRYGLLSLVLLAGWAGAGMAATQGQGREDYDIRLDSGKSASGLREAFRARAGKRVEADARRAAAIDADLARLRADVPSGTASSAAPGEVPQVIARRPGTRHFLTAPSDRPRVALLRDFLRRYPALYGLQSSQVDALAVEADYVNPDGQLAWVILQQRVHGVPVFQGEVRAGFTARGELIRTVASLAADVDAAVPDAWHDPADAVAAAARSVGYEVLAGQLARVARSVHADDVARFERGPFADTIEAERFYFPIEAGVLRPAWRVLLWEDVDAWYVLVDAESGAVLWRNNLTAFQTQASTYNVYANQSPAPLEPPPTSPNGAQPVGTQSRTSFTLIGAPFDNLGWITDGNNTTDGNNVEAGVDLVAPNGVDPGGTATGVPARTFNFAYDPYPGGTAPTDASLRNGAVTNLFYWANTFHDRTYALGFTEAARNYQNDNFGRGGIGGDRLSAEVQDSATPNNANFSAPADGGRGRFQVGIWTGTTPSIDAALDQDVSLHEISHGMTRRLVGNAAGLTGVQGQSLDEGWADCMSILLQWRSTDSLDAVYPMGEYATGGITPNNHYYGIRRFPYARIAFLGGPMNRPHNPLTLADIDPAQIALDDGAFARGPLGSLSTTLSHNNGEIWCSALFEIHALLLQEHGFPTGNTIALQAMVDGMKLTPNAPTFLQARDAFLDAIAATPGGTLNEALAWRGFALRGMGLDASVSPTQAVVESFDVPQLAQTPALSFTDLACNANGVAEPGEDLLLSVPITNTTGSPITGATVSVNGGTAVSYGTIAPGAVQASNIGVHVPSSQVCGVPFGLAIAIDSSAGPVLADRSLPIGLIGTVEASDFDSAPAGTLPPGWSTLVGGAGTLWTTVAGSPMSAPNAASVALPAMTANSDLVTRIYTAAEGATGLRFSHTYAFESNFDGGVLEISIDGGPFWDIVVAGGSFDTGGYDRVLTPFGSCAATPNVLGARMAWTGNGAVRTTHVTLPPSSVGHDVQLRWRAAGDCSVASGGWTIDDVEVVGAAVCAPAACGPAVFEDGFED